LLYPQNDVQLSCKYSRQCFEGNIRDLLLTGGGHNKSSLKEHQDSLKTE